MGCNVEKGDGGEHAGIIQSFRAWPILSLRSVDYIPILKLFGIPFTVSGICVLGLRTDAIEAIHIWPSMHVVGAYRRREENCFVIGVV